jgi:predicted cupin superfamily sugar epimerase
MTGNRADQLIQELDLQPHPEGGYFREVYRSATESDGRSVVTTIYFLLRAGEISRLHQVDADELWHWYEGAPLRLLSMTPGLDSLEPLSLGCPEDGCRPVLAIPANYWQAAESTGAYTLAGCTVAPGFEFSGFRFLDDNAQQESVQRAYPDATRFL